MNAIFKKYPRRWRLQLKWGRYARILSRNGNVVVGAWDLGREFGLIVRAVNAYAARPKPRRKRGKGKKR